MASNCSGCKDLRMMLFGQTKVGKSATANAIMGKETFKETETIQCEIQRGRVEGRNISVIDTPGINNISLTPEQWRAELKKGLLLSSPGPHVFLLVTKVGKFSEDGKNTVKWIRENFGENALKFSMILFIGREEMTNREWVKFYEDARTEDLISLCEGRYCVINSKREINPNQIRKLLEEIEVMVQQNGDQFYTQEMYGAVDRMRATEVTQKKEKLRKGHESEPEPEPEPNQGTDLKVQKEHAVIGNNEKHGNVTPPKKEETSVKPLLGRKGEMEATFVKEKFRKQEETRRKKERNKWVEERGATGGVRSDPNCEVRIVLLGGIGSGKSSSGNTILGREAFGKVMTMGKRQDGMVGNKSITVVDTKGYTYGSSQDDFSKYCEELEQCLSLCRPGPHVFLLVVPSPKTFSFPVQLLYRRFGPEVMKRILVLITHGDSWGRDHKAVLNNSSALQQLIQNCGEDYHIFNNQEKEDQSQVTELLRKIEILIEKNGQGYCTTEMYRRKLQATGSCSLI